jgi:hypothetical protein
MKKYIFEKKDEFGESLYLKDNGAFTYDVTEAKEIRLKWWEYLFKVLLQLINLYGSGKLKLKK